MAVLTGAEANELEAIRTQIKSLEVALLRAEIKALDGKIAALTAAKEERF